MNHWIVLGISLVPFLPTLALAIDYQKRLSEKRKRILTLLERTLPHYQAAFGGVSGTAGEVVDALFRSVYHKSSFAIALALNAAVIFLFTSVLIFDPPAFLLHFTTTVNANRGVLAGAFAGAYIWVTVSLISAYATDDLSPAALNAMWLRLLAAPIVSVGMIPLLPIGTSSSVAIAFMLAVLPVQSLQTLLRNIAKSRLGDSLSESPAQEPDLHHLQGMSERAVSRLAEEGIDTAQRLAYSDPLKLMVRTNLPWVVIVDLIDQALLFSYLREKNARTPLMGIRGSIEMARIGKDLFYPESPEVKSQAIVTIAEIANVLECRQESARYLVQTLWEDQQVQFVWSLFTEMVPDDVQSNRPEGDVRQISSPSEFPRTRSDEAPIGKAAHQP